MSATKAPEAKDQRIRRLEDQIVQLKRQLIELANSQSVTSAVVSQILGTVLKK